MDGDVAPESDSLKEGAVGTYSICQGQLVGSTPGAFNRGGEAGGGGGGAIRTQRNKREKQKFKL